MKVNKPPIIQDALIAQVFKQYMGQHTCKTQNLPKCRMQTSHRSLDCIWGNKHAKHTHFEDTEKTQPTRNGVFLFLGSTPSQAHYRHTLTIGLHHNNHRKHT